MNGVTKNNFFSSIGGPPNENDKWNTTPVTQKSLSLSQSKDTGKPKLLFFGPATDPDAVTRLTPLLGEQMKRKKARKKE